MKYGTALAILDDGTHLVVTGVFPTFATFKAHVVSCLKDTRREVSELTYAWHHERQTYNRREFLEVYFGE